MDYGKKKAQVQYGCFVDGRMVFAFWARSDRQAFLKCRNNISDMGFWKEWRNWEYRVIGEAA